MGKEDKIKKPTEKDDFNWGEARQNSAAKAFETLKKIVEAKVNERNKQTPEILNFKSPSDKEFWAWELLSKVVFRRLIQAAA